MKLKTEILYETLRPENDLFRCKDEETSDSLSKLAFFLHYSIIPKFNP